MKNPISAVVMGYAMVGMATLAAFATENAMHGDDDATRGPTEACPVLESRDWAAWIDAQPGPDAVRTLHVVGTVDLPTPGYRAVWRIGPADRRLPPAQTIELSLSAPTDPVGAVVTTERLTFQSRAAYPEYRAIVIRCGDQTLARIEEIPTAY